MSAIAIYSSKGGVGKTTLAVNLAWMSARRSKRRTLLWDLDPQGSTSFILSPREPAVQAREVLERELDVAEAVVPTAIEGLDLLAADSSIRHLDLLFAQLAKKKRLSRIIEDLARDYDRVILDCPPGLGLTSDQVIRAADLIVLPAIPSTLSQRAYEELGEHLANSRKDGSLLLPVFNMADRKRATHRKAIAAHPDWPIIPASGLAEQMADRHAALGSYASAAKVTEVIADLWVRIERRLSGGKK